MNKGELIDAIAEKADVSKKDADRILSAALETTQDAVSSLEHYRARLPA
jgi:DNA-binding protein HU-beta